ncbi:transporter substrate-binding domain-containing protein [Saccharopolyspora sp. ASAGF58]|uniref:transporter substrate-binding domain-containing protein n=1 Tax=Saccharopolyspora sp. ASAGF58 TaxID=2719023 RepID=UPI00144672D3|nr:transporter substrate-binding domain-containing protein [Saccharopolyspora sp. ASAGF58]
MWISVQPVNGLITGPQADKYDVLLATLFDMKERQQAIDFVDYARSGSAIMIDKSTADIKILGDLCGKTVAVQDGLLQERLVGTQSGKCTVAGKPVIDTKPSPKFSDEQLALATSSVQAIVHDLPALVYAANQTPVQGLVVLTDPAAPGGYEAASVGIGVAKDDTAMRDAILDAVSQLIADGTYKEIFSRYSPEASIIDKPTTNQSSQDSTELRRAVHNGTATRPPGNVQAIRFDASGGRGVGGSCLRQPRRTAMNGSERQRPNLRFLCFPRLRTCSGGTGGQGVAGSSS